MLSKDHIALILGNIFSKLGTWLNFVAIILIVQAEYQTALSISMVIICKRLPSVLFSYLGGKIADDWDPKKSILILNSIFFILVFSLYSISFKTANYFIPLMLIYSCISLIEGMYKPTLRSLNIHIDSQSNSTQKVSSLLSSTGMLTVIIANFLSVFIYDIFGLKTLLLINMAFFALSLVCFLSIKTSQTVKHLKNEKTSSQTYSHVLIPSNHKFFIGVNLYLSVLFSYVALVTTKFPFEVYLNGDLGTGLLNLFIGLSIIIATFLFKKFSNIFNVSNSDNKSIAYILCSMSFFIVLFSHTKSFYIACFYLFCCMAIFCFSRISIEDTLQNQSPKYLVGRIFSINFILQEITISLSLIIFSLVADYWSFEQVGRVYSLLFLTVAIIFAIYNILKKQDINLSAEITRHIKIVDNNSGVNK
jgi:predicted MFS family arabinose efflux permease